MREPLRVFIGYDSKEPVAFHVLSHSILTRASGPVSITPLRQDTLRSAGIYTRDRGPTESTEFSLTRFLVPYLSGFWGKSIFMDSDMLCRCDITELVGAFERDMVASKLAHPRALLCCQHEYTPNVGVKFLGNIQTAYPRKNWSSFMLFNNDKCRTLTPEYVNTATGLELHRFQWLPDAEIGALSLGWNYLVGEYVPVGLLVTEPKIVHWTNGGPWFSGYEESDYAAEWFEEWDKALGRSKVAA